MRSMRLLAATTLIVLGVAACGDDNNEPDNEAPNASFTQVCTGLSCVFTDGSTDSDGSIASRAWTFESGTPLTSADAAPTVAFPAAGTYTVTLTVTDNEGATDDVSQEVTVSGGTGNLPPTASFTLPACTAGTPCGFHSTSTDDVAILTTSWDFGDGSAPAQGTDATHTFVSAGTYNVTLTVTDDQGLTGTVTQALTVTAPSAQDCTTSTNQSGGRVVNCVLTLTQRSTVTLAITSLSCELGGNSLSVTVPRAYVVFSNLCFRTVGEQATVNDINGDPIVFEVGSTLALRFNQGTADPGDPLTGDPGIDLTAATNSWTLNIDDGGNAGAEGEPDFNDAVITVTATAAP